ncbi:MAG: ROK family protein, partial [Ruminococcaceae bacterium]|nr:ROK family protein [Oscillospiraceae bacterium]
MKKYIMGIDIGGTKCAVLLGRAQGDADDIIIDKLRFETRVGRGWRAVTEELLDNVEEIIKKNAISPEDIFCAGISCGGPLDSRRGVILAPPNLPDWECVPIVDMIEERFGFDAYLQNDANACALAEWKFGAGKGLRNMIFLTFGTGMGAGLDNNEENAGLVKTLLSLNMPIDAKTLGELAKTVLEFPDTSDATIANLMRLQIPVTQENITQFEAYKSYEHSVLSDINT